MRAVADSGRWRRERTHPGRLGDLAVEAGRVSGCASSARTASRSSCVPVATARIPRCRRKSGQRLGRVRGCRAGSCARFLRAALRFEWADIAVELAGTIQKRLAFVHGAARPEPLSARAVVDVAGRIISKVAAREGAVIPLRFIEHRNMGWMPPPRPASSASEPPRKRYPRQAAPA